MLESCCWEQHLHDSARQVTTGEMPCPSAVSLRTSEQSTCQYAAAKQGQADSITWSLMSKVVVPAMHSSSVLSALHSKNASATYPQLLCCIEHWHSLKSYSTCCTFRVHISSVHISAFHCFITSHNLTDATAVLNTKSKG